MLSNRGRLEGGGWGRRAGEESLLQGGGEAAGKDIQTGNLF